MEQIQHAIDELKKPEVRHWFEREAQREANQLDRHVKRQRQQHFRAIQKRHNA